MESRYSGVALDPQGDSLQSFLSFSVASLPPIICLYIVGISPFVNFIMIGIAWSAALVPLLVMLFYFSTPSPRRQPIFIMNAVSVAMRIALSFDIATISIKGIRHPEEPYDENAVIAAIASALLLPVFIDVILAFRLYIVLPRRTTSNLIVCIVFAPHAIFKVARLMNDVLSIIKFASVLRKGGPATGLMGFEHGNPNHKIEWCFLVSDNRCASNSRFNDDTFMGLFFILIVVTLQHFSYGKSAWALGLQGPLALCHVRSDILIVVVID
ncbi:hypothetical protein BDN71DRAFT_1398326 [Pleurotus eryngii]|uniref:Uncharacterized protein n=1 Tax=Pleurotus eryngii TaxID=5323 RepID=A0A9P5ZSA9_PLEER|nr:hypothetical protein BDN71DRAFT_1398326 [Pleurotus eryngii]